MCGLAGFVGDLGSSLAAVRGWGDRLAHRGPDDRGIAVLDAEGLSVGRDPGRIDAEAQAVVWHRRLSIIDLTEAGWQPMVSRDGRHALALNGEIYNYRELRAELEARGVRFRSQSDTEVLLEGFRCWGVAVLPRLVGMFAIAILDAAERTLWLARDPFGIKPLYYARVDRGFAFASEQKALLDLPQASRLVDAQSIYDYLRFGLTDHTSQTMFEAIQSCPPAHWMKVPVATAQPSEPERYWQIDLDQRFTGTFDQAAERLRELFLDSVGLHLRSDVPVGAALSGGIDSSAIVLAMRAIEPDVEIHTFSYVADDAALDEERWADLAGRAAGATLHKTHASARDLVEDLDVLLRTQDEPFAGTSVYAQHRVFRLAAAAGIKVMLDGQGADELLGGYHGLVAARLASLVKQGRWAEALRFARHASSSPERRALLLWSGEFLVPSSWQGPFRQMVGQELTPAWLNRDWFAAHGVETQPAKYVFGSSREVLREQMNRLLTHANLPMLLRFEDRNSMAHSIESRVPFLTPQLAQFLMSLPEEFLIDREGRTKAVFREAMRGLVPDAILDRQDKIGFATPEHRWLGELRPYVDRLLASEPAARVPALRLDVVRSEWRAIQARPRARDYRAWRWVNLIEWACRTGAVFA